MPNPQIQRQIVEARSKQSYVPTMPWVEEFRAQFKRNYQCWCPCKCEGSLSDRTAGVRIAWVSTATWWDRERWICRQRCSSSPWRSPCKCCRTLPIRRSGRRSTSRRSNRKNRSESPAGRMLRLCGIGWMSFLRRCSEIGCSEETVKEWKSFWWERERGRRR